jgi:hypothetical protein
VRSIVIVKFDENTFHDNNDALTTHQSAIHQFESTHGGKENKMRRRSNKNGPLEPTESLTFRHGDEIVISKIYELVRKSKDEKSCDHV